MNRKPKSMPLDNEEKEIEKNFKQLKSYAPATKAKKMKLYEQAAKN